MSTPATAVSSHPVDAAQPVDAGSSGLPAAAPLVVEHLSVAYGGSYGSAGPAEPVVQDVSFTVAPGQVVAIVGESGSGKSSTAAAILGLLPSGGRITQGRISVAGTDVTGAGERVMRGVRGRVVGFVPQDPMVGLNPTMRIGAQVAEAVRRRGVPRRSVSAEVIAALEAAGIDEPVLRARQHPHELSGGQRQRVLIAIALAGHPRLLIADEPTSALDATVQQRILDHLRRLVATHGTSLLIITHDLGVAADHADQVIVLSRGRVVEAGRPRDVIGNPQHAYTQRLVDAAPGLRHLRPGATTRRRDRPAPATPSAPALVLEHVTKDFPLPRGSRSARGERTLRALDDVSLAVPRGGTLALVGESGSGKTTALRVAMGLAAPTSGRVVVDGTDITGMRWRQLRGLRRRFQFVHQNPFASLDPRWSVRDLVAEPLDSFAVGTPTERTDAVHALLERVALPREFARRRPAELSGGQRQRVAIARALALQPELVLLDEPVSALDVSVQAQVLDLLADLQRDLGLSYLVISHDLAVVADISDEVAVMGSGRIVEHGPTAAVFADPQADLTRELLAAASGRRTTTRDDMARDDMARQDMTRSTP